ncbi:hypothetical protein HYPSUDRAFT_66381 [Hypholoma sublateritium FD-334 SS-4]|uniref:Uncharacterized protein n=1 Tax=Hypholoma sublateritium (strain FD-334 SS-4) TaxID=945553 RepID=A0A0D2NXF0_HYPSF|nr:hypothetical protein HYPSUDRAFT_66381 [Hypholoma sublateritium FD-334 SS-4]
MSSCPGRPAEVHDCVRCSQPCRNRGGQLRPTHAGGHSALPLDSAVTSTVLDIINVVSYFEIVDYISEVVHCCISVSPSSIHYFTPLGTRIPHPQGSIVWLPRNISMPQPNFPYILSLFFFVSSFSYSFVSHISLILAWIFFLLQLGRKSGPPATLKKITIAEDPSVTCARKRSFCTVEYTPAWDVNVWEPSSA